MKEEKEEEEEEENVRYFQFALSWKWKSIVLTTKPIIPNLVLIINRIAII